MAIVKETEDTQQGDIHVHIGKKVVSDDRSLTSMVWCHDRVMISVSRRPHGRKITECLGE